MRDAVAFDDRLRFGSMRTRHRPRLRSWGWAAAGCLVGLSLPAGPAAGSAVTNASDPADGRYVVTYQGEYTFSLGYVSGGPSKTAQRLHEEQRLRWVESEIVTVKEGTATETPAPLKLEGSLVATDQQDPDKPADRENCNYTAWRDPNGSPLAKEVVLRASAPTVEPYGLQVIHPVMTVTAGIPSAVSIQVDQHGTTTGAYKIARDCVNPTNPGGSVLMSDEDDSGGVVTNFTPTQQTEYGVAASPSASFLLATLPHTARFDADAVAHSPDSYDGDEALQRVVQSTITVQRLKA